MSAVRQKEKPSAAGTAKGARIRPGRRVHRGRYHLHHTIPLNVCQTVRGAVAGLSFLGLLGVMGGMERGSTGELAGIAWMAALMAGFVWGCRPWLK